MPELPEVETIRRGLEQKLKGQIFDKVECNWRKQINYSLKKYNRLIKGLQIKEVRRRAKLLYFELSKGYKLAIHLKMTGQLVFKHGKEIIAGGHPIKDGTQDLPNKHTHVIFYFKSGDILYFNDTRKFGWAKLFTDKEFSEKLRRLDYGPEPLSDDFNLNYFRTVIKKFPQRKIKHLCMDQKIIAGLGNIYCDETLFYAKVHPERRVKDLKPQEIKKIFQGIKKILPKAIECGGSSVASHLDAFGRKGTYAQYHKVYGLWGQPCPICKTKLKKVKVGGRTSTFCPKCQT